MDEYLLSVLEQKDKLADELHSLNSEYARLKARLGMSEFQKEKLQAASRAQMRRSPTDRSIDGGAASAAAAAPPTFADQITSITAERDVMAARLTAANESVKTLTAQLAASRRTQVSRESERRRRKQVFRGEIEGTASAHAGGEAAAVSSSSNTRGEASTSEDADRKAEIVQLQDCLATQVEHTEKQATEIEQLKADLLAAGGVMSPPLSPLEDPKSQVARLSKLLASKDTELQDANTELEMLRSLMGSGSTSNAASRAKELQMATELGTAQASVGLLKLENAALKEELADAKKAANGKAGSFQTDIAAWKAEAAALKEDLSAAQKKVDQLTIAVTEATKIANVKTEAAGSAAEQVEAHKNEVRAAQAVAAEYLEAATISEERQKQAEVLFTAEQLRRRALHNKLVELCGNIRVHCKVRPMLAGNTDPQAIVVLDDCLVEAQVQGKAKSFEFDRAYDTGTTSDTVFNEVKSIVGSFVDGYNACIMAYGQTGSGKTHTMLGPSTDVGLCSNLDGVIPRSVTEIFRLAEEDGANASFTFAVSVLEVYNEAVRDLLSETPDERHDVTEGSGISDVPTAIQCSVSDADEVLSLVRKGMSSRVERSTDMNAHSSRSHLIVTVHCVRTALRESLGMTTASRMHLVDLAGSENAKMAGHDLDGKALTEGRAINRSLSALADVLTALGSANLKQHVPYRNSRLTHLLKDSIGGDAKMLMIVCLSPGSATLTESIQSLRFGIRARAIEKGPAAKKVVNGSGADHKGKGGKR